MLWKNPKKLKGWFEQIANLVRGSIARTIDRAGQFIHRNRAATATASLFLACLLGGVIAISWQLHRANIANTGRSSKAVPGSADLRRINYFDALDSLIGPSQTREDRNAEQTTDLRRVADASIQALTLRGYRDDALETSSVEPAAYREGVRDTSNDRTYPRTIPVTYPNPGGVLYLTSVDPVALGPAAGDYLVLINKPQEALDAFRQRLAIAEQAIAVDPENLNVQNDLAYTSSRIGDLLADMGDHVGAVPYYQRAVDIYIKNATADPDNAAVPLQLSRLLAKLAMVHTRLGYIEKAWGELIKASEILESVFIDPTDLDQRRIRASGYTEIAEAYSLLARDTRTPQQALRKLWAAAREMYERSLGILYDLRERGALTVDEATEIDTVIHKIAECDLFLAK